MNSRQRAIVAAITAGILYVGAFATLGYFIGVSDGGVLVTGWQGAAWVGSIALATIAGVAVLLGAMIAVVKWIARGDS